jgi:hypothetical protein
MMKQSGKIHWMAALGGLGMIAAVGLFFMGGDSPVTAAGSFMSALAKGDTEALADFSYIEGKTRVELIEEWDYATKVAAPHYQFKYEITTEVRTSPELSIVKMKLWQNVDRGGYDEKFALPMVKKDGKWLVEIRGLSRDMYPALPR